MKRWIAALTLVLCVLMLATTVSGAEERSGISHERMVTRLIEYPVGAYNCEKLLETLPVTMEAWVYLPSATYESLGGTILGNKPQKNTACFTFSIEENGVPQLAFGYKGGEKTYKFTAAPVPADTWTHVAIVYGTGTEGKQVSCYINGELKSSSAVKNWYAAGRNVLDLPVGVAGDRQQVNFEGFLGTLGDVTAYSTARTQAQIQADYANGPELTDSELLLHYDMDAATYGEDIPDASGNGYDMIYEKMWLTQEERDAIMAQDKNEYTYSIAFVPDVQILTDSYATRLGWIYDYLLENKESQNIQYVISLGDLSDENTEVEWERFSKNQNRLNGILPYSLIRGNHDITYNDYAAYYDQYFSVPGEYYYDFVTANGGFYDTATTANTYLLFSVGEVDYIILNIDFAMSQGVFDWMNQVLTEFSDRRAIVVTHGYIGTNGQLLDETMSGAPSGYDASWLDPEDMWNEVLRKHANVDLVAGGHIGSDHIICSQQVGDNGNVVHQMLSDTQYVDTKIRGAGIVTMMHFTEDGRFARVEHYSTANKAYFRESNYNIALDFDAGEIVETQTKEGYCEACKADKTWKPLTTDFGVDDSQPNISGGHYYLPENMTAYGKTILSGNTVCLDLNGHTYTANEHITLNKGARMNIQGATGILRGCGDPAGNPGGAIYVKAGAQLDLYSGTLTAWQSERCTAGNGGVVAAYGTFNMYGGTLCNGVSQGVGGTLFVDRAGIFHMSGGEIYGGTAPTCGCAYTRGFTTLSGDATIEFLMASPKSGNTTVADLLTIRGKYTGSVCLSYSAASAENTVMGISDSADLSDANIFFTNNDLRVKAVDNTLVAYLPNGADVITADGSRVSYDTLAEALTAIREGETLILNQGTTSAVAVPVSITLDLCGRKIDNTLTAAAGATVYVMDSTTADYRIEDGVYGKVKGLSGNILPAQATETRDPYLQIFGTKYYSYHAVGLNISAMSLRPGDAGVYYSNTFAGDEMVVARVASYGIALNAAEAPTGENMETTSLYTALPGADFAQGRTTAGVLLSGILKDTNTEYENLSNGNLPVYGRAYIQLDDGSYLFGVTRARSLRDQLVDIDNAFDALTRTQQEGVAALCRKYEGLTQAWDLSNTEAYLSENP